MTDSCRVSGEVDIYAAAGIARKMSRELGFGQADVARIEIVVRELASNIVRHAGSGRIRMRKLTEGHCQGIEVEAEDHGPGIPDLDLALQDGFSTGDKGLGSGLPAVRRLMDAFEIVTGVGQGTTVRAARWLRRPANWLNCLWKRE